MAIVLNHPRPIVVNDSHQLPIILTEVSHYKNFLEPYANFVPISTVGWPRRSACDGLSNKEKKFTPKPDVITQKLSKILNRHKTGINCKTPSFSSRFQKECAILISKPIPMGFEWSYPTIIHLFLLRVEFHQCHQCVNGVIYCCHKDGVRGSLKFHLWRNFVCSVPLDCSGQLCSMLSVSFLGTIEV